MADSPFDSIESAHEYVHLLITQVDDVDRGIADDIRRSEADSNSRRVDALRLVDYKLTQLQHHLTMTARLLNDLKTLRRLLLR